MQVFATNISFAGRLGCRSNTWDLKIVWLARFLGILGLIWYQFHLDPDHVHGRLLLMSFVKIVPYIFTLLDSSRAWKCSAFWPCLYSLPSSMLCRTWLFELCGQHCSTIANKSSAESLPRSYPLYQISCLPLPLLATR